MENDKHNSKGISKATNLNGSMKTMAETQSFLGKSSGISFNLNKDSNHQIISKPSILKQANSNSQSIKINIKTSKNTSQEETKFKRPNLLFTNTQSNFHIYSKNTLSSHLKSVKNTVLKNPPPDLSQDIPKNNSDLQHTLPKSQFLKHRFTLNPSSQVGIFLKDGTTSRDT